jgi:hypothetical protein
MRKLIACMIAVVTLIGGGFGCSSTQVHSEQAGTGDAGSRAGDPRSAANQLEVDSSKADAKAVSTTNDALAQKPIPSVIGVTNIRTLDGSWASSVHFEGIEQPIGVGDRIPDTDFVVSEVSWENERVTVRIGRRN